MLKGALAVIIVRIDNGKRLVYKFPATKNCVRGAPRLCALGGAHVSVRQLVRFLKGVFNLHLAFNMLCDHFAEIFLYCVLYNENYLVKACLNGVINRKIKQSLAVFADGGYLF